jgi:hypothetical protein
MTGSTIAMKIKYRVIPFFWRLYYNIFTKRDKLPLFKDYGVSEEVKAEGGRE